jgi:dihydrofolate reductase
MRISIIVAISENNVIGRDGDLPWRLSSDLRRFKATTMGHHLIMGRRTYESIGRPLPGRTSIVLSRRAEIELGEGVLRAPDWHSAVALAASDDEVFVIGGAQIYALALPHADRLYLTRVSATVVGDVYFPDWKTEQWKRVHHESHAADDRNDYSHTFEVYDRLQFGR